MWLVLGSDASLAASKTVYLDHNFLLCPPDSVYEILHCVGPMLYHLSLTGCPTLGSGQAVQEPQGSYTQATALLLGSVQQDEDLRLAVL